MRRFAALLIFASAVACTTTSTTTATPTLDGYYAGTTAGTTFTLSLASGGDGLLMGNGTVGSGATARMVSAWGTYQHPQVTFNLSSPASDSLVFTGTRSGDQLTGTLRGSGFTGAALTLTLHR